MIAYIFLPVWIMLSLFVFLCGSICLSRREMWTGAALISVGIVSLGFSMRVTFSAIMGMVNYG